MSDFRRADGARAEDVRGQPPTSKLRRAKEDRGQRSENDEIRRTKEELMLILMLVIESGWPRRIRPLADLLKVIGYLGSAEHGARSKQLGDGKKR